MALNKIIIGIEKSFNKIELGEEYTLLELDFFDTSNQYFSSVSPELLKILNTNAAEFVSSYWPISSREIALDAIAHRKKAENPYKSWQEIPFDYFNIHDAAGYLSSKAFQYYLPAAMIGFIRQNEINEDADFIDGFLSVLLRHHETYIDYFSVDQLRSVALFLRYYASTKYMHPNDEESLQKTLVLLDNKLS